MDMNLILFSDWFFQCNISTLTADNCSTTKVFTSNTAERQKVL